MDVPREWRLSDTVEVERAGAQAGARVKRLGLISCALFVDKARLLAERMGPESTVCVRPRVRAACGHVRALCVCVCVCARVRVCAFSFFLLGIDTAVRLLDGKYYASERGRDEVRLLLCVCVCALARTSDVAT